MVVELTTVTSMAAVPPRVTAVAPVKSVPVMVMAVPPSVEPLFGEILVTVGGALPITSISRYAVPPFSKAFVLVS